MEEDELKPKLEGAESFCPTTLMETPEWQEIIEQENIMGTDTLLANFLEQPILTTVEILWVTRSMLIYYGRKNALVQVIPKERLQKNMSSLLHILALLLDLQGEVPEKNVLFHMTGKLRDACWGLTNPTRKYLEK